MKNAAIIPDLLSETDELMTSICKNIPPQGTPEDVLTIVTSHRKKINEISVKTQPLITALNLNDKIDEKYSELKLWSKQNPNFSLPVVAWNYFTLSIITSTEESLLSNVVKLIPIVDRSFTDYFLEQVH